MDIPTAARLLSRTVFAVRELCRSGELVYVAIGHKWLLSPDAVRAFISQPGAKDIASSGSMSAMNPPRMVTKVFCFVVENLIFSAKQIIGFLSTAVLYLGDSGSEKPLICQHRTVIQKSASVSCTIRNGYKFKL
jgi:hypothetical protein